MITQEVTYETLLHQKRRELHGLVGQAIEELYQDRIEEQVSLLYRHFSMAEDWPKAAAYGRRAANRAYRLGQFQEAVVMYDHAQSCLIGEDFGVLTRVNEVLEIAEKTDSPIIRYLCYAAKGNAFMAVEQTEAARKFYEKALRSIEGTEHKRYLEEVYQNLIETTLFLGDISAAEKYFHDAAPLRKLNPDRTEPRFDFLKGRLLTEADSPDYAGADKFFLKSIDADETSGAVVPAAQTKFHRAALLARMGEAESGRFLLTEIQKKFENWVMPAWRLKCERALPSV